MKEREFKAVHTLVLVVELELELLLVLLVLLVDKLVVLNLIPSPSGRRFRVI